MSKPRILVLRGGAIGDFILTLPALRLLRETFAHCHLEIVGYPHIASLALHGGPEPGSTYADALRHIEAGPLASFFARQGNLPDDWCEYFASFQQVVSWLFDPDGIFEANVKRTGAKHFLSAYAKITDEAHATAQLARGLERLALYLDQSAARLVPGSASAEEAQAWLAAHTTGPSHGPWLALHPGSGSPRKNWPAERWRDWAARATAAGRKLLLIGGEADEAALAALAPFATATARSQPLPLLAALLAQCDAYFGHDTGISHLAAAVGTPSTLLFGPTDPTVWAPLGPHVQIIPAPGGDLTHLELDHIPVP